MSKKKAKKPISKIKDNPYKIQKKCIIAAFGVCGIVKRSLEVAGVTRAQFTRWLKTDPKFAAAMELAREDAVDGLELEAFRRAKEGTKRVVLYKGRPVMIPKDLKNPKSQKEIYVENDYSDSLLMFLLKGHRPEKYRENAGKLNVDGELQIKTLDGVSIEQL